MFFLQQMVYALIMFALNALGLPINKEAGVLSIDISNSKETSSLKLTL